MSEESMHILIVDDDETDRELFSEAAGTTIPEVLITEAENGEKALDVLRGLEKLPDLIILDLNMPVMDGRETLKLLKNDPELKAIPVCILTTSNAGMDIRKAYGGGANLFQVKPLQFTKLQEMLKNLHIVFRNRKLHRL